MAKAAARSPADPQSSAPRGDVGGWTIPVALLLLGGLIWGCAAFMQIEARRSATSQAQQAIVTIALGLEHDIERTLASYDLSLQATRQGLRMSGIDQLSPELRDALLFDGSVQADDVSPISVLGPDGRLVYRSAPVAVPDTGAEGRTAGAPAIRFDDRDYFKAHVTDHSMGLFVGAPFQNRYDGQWSVPLSRRLENGDGSFAGVVAGSIRLRYFRTLFARLQLGEGGVLSLQSSQGTPIERFPGQPAGQSGSPAGLKVDVAPDFASDPDIWLPLTASSAVDGIERMFVFRRVGAFPLVIGVGIGTAELYRDWRRQTTAIALVLLVVTAIGIGLVMLLRRELARRRYSEQMARETAARLAMLADHASDVMMQAGWDGRRKFVSSACLRVFGRSVAELMTTQLGAFVHPDDQPRTKAALAELRAGREVGLMAYRVSNGGGGWNDVETNARRLPNDDGVIFVIRDVTERVRLNRRMEQSQRMEAIGQLTAGVAHDFNNMLQAQMSRLEKLTDELADRQPARRLLDDAIDMAERGARLTQQLLSFSRQQPLRPASVSLVRLLRHMASVFQQMLGPRVQVSAEGDPGMPPVLVDPAYLEAALLNLALNARDAMPAGGHLRLSGVRQSDLAVGPPAELDPACAYAVVLVTDDGGGMDEATLRRACEPFFTTKGLNGTGLGLASVQGFARQSGGELRITSVAGQGTRVEIWLPATVAEEPRANMLSAPRAEAGSAHVPPARVKLARVLLVDDEPSVLEAVGACLRDAGFEVEEAGEAEAALRQMASAGPFDALITDFVLPGANGDQLIATARSDHPGLATVVITGWAVSERLGHLPVDTEVLYKPFRRDELVARVQRAIDAAKTARLRLPVDSDGPST